jgi:hypothetical protein
MKETKQDFLSIVMGNPARARLLRVFIFNPEESLTIEQAGKRAGVTVQNAKREIALLERNEIIKKAKGVHFRPLNGKATRSTKRGRTTAEQAWSLNTEHRHVGALTLFVGEVSPVKHDSIVSVLKRTGRLSTIILSGSFMGDPTRPADLLVAADAYDERRLELAIRGLEPAFGREIRYAAFLTPEFRYRITIQDRLIRDTLDYPHEVIFDRAGFFLT